jgi:hypothetical protein
MSLNLAHIREQIKSSDLSPARFNPGQPLATNEAYKTLKSLGWTCQNNEVHPTDHVPVFRLGGASIRRDKQNPGDWIVDVAGGIFNAGGDLEAITVHTVELDRAANEPLPMPLSPVEQIAALLKSEYPHLCSRIDSALALVEAGEVEFPKYQTSSQYAGGGKPNRDCNCPDALHRGFRAEWGIACKHTICHEILYRAGREFNQVVQREIVDRSERNAARAAAYELALAPDPLNRQRDGRRMYVEGVGHR